MYLFNFVAQNDRFSIDQHLRALIVLVDLAVGQGHFTADRVVRGGWAIRLGVVSIHNIAQGEKSLWTVVRRGWGVFTPKLDAVGRPHLACPLDLNAGVESTIVRFCTNLKCSIQIK